MIESQNKQKETTFYFRYQMKLEFMPYVQQQIIQFLDFFTNNLDQPEVVSKLFYIMKKKIKQVEQFQFKNWNDYRSIHILHSKKMLVDFWKIHRDQIQPKKAVSFDGEEISEEQKIASPFQTPTGMKGQAKNKFEKSSDKFIKSSPNKTKQSPTSQKQSPIHQKQSPIREKFSPHKAIKQIRNKQPKQRSRVNINLNQLEDSWQKNMKPQKSTSKDPRRKKSKETSNQKASISMHQNKRQQKHKTHAHTQSHSKKLTKEQFIQYLRQKQKK